jgi:hypothetical protein
VAIHEQAPFLSNEDLQRLTEGQRISYEAIPLFGSCVAPIDYSQVGEKLRAALNISTSPQVLGRRYVASVRRRLATLAPQICIESFVKPEINIEDVYLYKFPANSRDSVYEALSQQGFQPNRDWRKDIGEIKYLFGRAFILPPRLAQIITPFQTGAHDTLKTTELITGEPSANKRSALANASKLLNAILLKQSVALLSLGRTESGNGLYSLVDVDHPHHSGWILGRNRSRGKHKKDDTQRPDRFVKEAHDFLMRRPSQLDLLEYYSKFRPDHIQTLNQLSRMRFNESLNRLNQMRARLRERAQRSVFQTIAETNTERVEEAQPSVKSPDTIKPYLIRAADLLVSAKSLVEQHTRRTLIDDLIRYLLPDVYRSITGGEHSPENDRKLLQAIFIYIDSLRDIYTSGDRPLTHVEKRILSVKPKFKRKQIVDLIKD